MKRRVFRVWTRDNPTEAFAPQAGDPQPYKEAQKEAEILKDHGVMVKILPEVTESLGDWT